MFEFRGITFRGAKEIGGHVDPAPARSSPD
jgi:hypothetical protein